MAANHRRNKYYGGLYFYNRSLFSILNLKTGKIINGFGTVYRSELNRNLQIQLFLYLSNRMKKDFFFLFNK